MKFSQQNMHAVGRHTEVVLVVEHHAREDVRWAQGKDVVQVLGHPATGTRWGRTGVRLPQWHGAGAVSPVGAGYLSRAAHAELATVDASRTADSAQRPCSMIRAP